MRCSTCSQLICRAAAMTRFDVIGQQNQAAGRLEQAAGQQQAGSEQRRAEAPSSDEKYSGTSQKCEVQNNGVAMKIL